MLMILLTTKTRQIAISLSYNDVVQHVGKSTQSDSTMIFFFVEMATLCIHAGVLSTVVTTRNTFTRIGTNYVLSHDIIDYHENDNVVPSVSIALYDVHKHSEPTHLWGFISFNVSLQTSVIVAGITFDDDVIPIDSVTGLMIHCVSQDNAVNTNPYPCIHQEITLVNKCCLRMCLNFTMTLKDIYMSINSYRLSLHCIILNPTYICCISIKRHIMLNKIIC